MKLRVLNNQIIDLDTNKIIANLTVEGSNLQVERTIEMGSDAVPAVEAFVKEVNSGSFKPRTVVKRFEKLLEKYDNA